MPGRLQGIIQVGIHSFLSTVEAADRYGKLNPVFPVRFRGRKRDFGYALRLDHAFPVDLLRGARESIHVGGAVDPKSAGGLYDKSILCARCLRSERMKNDRSGKRNNLRYKPAGCQQEKRDRFCRKPVLHIPLRYVQAEVIEYNIVLYLN